MRLDVPDFAPSVNASQLMLTLTHALHGDGVLGGDTDPVAAGLQTLEKGLVGARLRRLSLVTRGGIDAPSTQCCGTRGR